MSRISKKLACVLAVVFVSSVAWANDNVIPKYHMRTGHTRVDARNYPTPQSGNSGGRTFGSQVRMGAATISPATQMGDTWYDGQHNSTVGRQVDHGPGAAPGSHYVQAAWMRGAGPSETIRTVQWNRVSVTGSPADFILDNGETLRRVPLGSALLPGGQPFTAVRPGFANFSNQPNGKGVVQYHDAPEPGQVGNQYWETQLDQSIGSGIFGSASKSPNPPLPDHQADAVIWPKSAITQCGADYIHHGIGTWSGAAPEVWYWRGVISTVPGTISWASMPGGVPIMLDSVSSGGVSATVAARGNNVAVVLGKNLNSTNADVVYYKSTDCGVSWGPRINITNFASSDPDGFWDELGCVFDENDNLHIVYNTGPASGLEFPVNLYHWDAVSNTNRLISSSNWVNSCGGGTIATGAGNGAGSGRLAIADVGISVKPDPDGGGIETQRVYAIWTQYGPTDTDCSTVDALGTLGGLVNSDLWVSVSSNGGSTWDRPQNVTGTETPDCLPGDCFAEAWVTPAPLADSGLYLSYVEDTHSGWVVQGGGAWTLSPYSVLAAEARAPVLEPVIAVSPSNIIELNAKTSGGTETTQFSVISVGNADLTFSIAVTNDEGGASHVLVNGGGTYGNTILAGGPPDLITVTYDAIGLTDPSEHNWRLEVTSNDPTNDPGQGGAPIDVMLEVFAAEVWYTCKDDTLTTGTHTMNISSCLEMGKSGVNGTGFVSPAEWMYSGSPVVTRKKFPADPDTLIAYHNAFMNLGERVRAKNKSFRAQSEMYIKRDSSVTSGDSTFTADVAKGEVSSTDSTIGLDYEVLFFKHPALQNGAVYKFNMFNRTASTISGISYGVVADLDVGDDAGANDGRGDEGKGWIGGVGGDNASGVFVPDNNFMSLFYLPLVGPCDKAGAKAAQVIANNDYIVPSSRYRPDSLYVLFDTFGAASSWGTNIHIDTGQTSDDISVMMVNAHNQSLTAAGTIQWGYGFAVSTVGISDMESTIEVLRFAANSNCALGCPITLTGDLNLTGTITSADIIVAVNYVFKGGPDPQPCPASADVNCGGTVTSADIIILVNYVFKGGPAPCDACISPLAGDC